MATEPIEIANIGIISSTKTNITFHIFSVEIVLILGTHQHIFLLVLIYFSWKRSGTRYAPPPPPPPLPLGSVRHPHRAFCRPLPPEGGFPHPASVLPPPAASCRGPHAPWNRKSVKFGEYRVCMIRLFLFILHALHTRSELCVPRNETARPRSQFPRSCIWERFIYLIRIFGIVCLQYVCLVKCACK
jgi:hypothetical protein